MQLPPVFDGDAQRQRAHQERDHQLLMFGQFEHYPRIFRMIEVEKQQKAF